MKILLRSFGKDNYVWKEAQWTPSNGYHILDENNKDAGKIDFSSIISVSDDDRVNYVICNSCNQLVRNTPKDLENHYKKMENSRNCLKCRYLKKPNRKEVETKFIKQSDGKYKIIEIYCGTLMCGTTYANPSINSESAMSNCIHNRCRTSGTSTINDFFVKYPGVFDTIITVDALIEKKWTFERITNGYNDNKCLIYDAGMRDALKAYTNNGIVDHFIVRHAGRSWSTYYSLKYDKLFFLNYYGYDSEKPYDMSEAKYNNVHKKLAALYEEATKND